VLIGHPTFKAETSAHTATHVQTKRRTFRPFYKTTATGAHQIPDVESLIFIFAWDNWIENCNILQNSAVQIKILFKI
jgi:hypothetical protein